MRDFFVNLGYLVAFLPIFYAACALVQSTVLRPKTRYVVIGSFGTLAFLLGLTGIFYLAIPSTAENVATQRQSGILLLVIAGVTFLPMFKRVRLLLGRLTPIDPNSTVDISGVIVALWFIVVSGTVLFTINLEELSSQVSITVGYSIISVIAYPAIALSLVGIWFTRTPREAIARLGLGPLDWRQVAASFGLVVPMLIIVAGLDALGRRLQPDLYAQLEQVLRSMSSNVTNPAVAIFIAFCAGIGEEILFRGAIQPRLGIGITAFLFAVAHTQYGLSYGTIGIFIMGLILGYQRQRMNTTACILTHGAYNTVAFLASLAGGGT